MLTRPERNAQIIKDWSRSWAFFESFVIVRGFTLFPWWRDDKNILFYRKFVKLREFIKSEFKGPNIYTILQNKRMRRCGVPPPPPPPPIIFEWIQLPQQIIYRRKGNLSESPNHLKYWGNILISRFYEQFSRSSRNLGHFWKFEKISNS